MSTRTVAFLSTGFPDPTQGGSGIFNYLVCRRLLADGYRVRAFFRASRWFADTVALDHRLEELTGLGLEAQVVWEDGLPVPRFATGETLLGNAHQFALCESVVAEHRKTLESVDAIVGLDLGWANALATVDVPRVVVLGDPYFRRLATLRPLALLDRGSWTTHLHHLSVEAALRGSVGRRLKAYGGAGSALVSFSPQHAEEYRRAGVPVRHARWFVPGPARAVREPALDPLCALHVGSLESSASRTMLRFWERELLPALARLPVGIDLQLAGAIDVPPALADPPDNVRVIVPGRVRDDELEGYYRTAAVFLSPMPYPIGVRTRILSALAHAVPVIAHPSAATGLPELRDGVDVLYARSGDAVAAALATIADAPERAEQLGREGRRTWERLFNPERNLPALLALAGLGPAGSEAVQLVAEPKPLEGGRELG